MSNNEQLITETPLNSDENPTIRSSVENPDVELFASLPGAEDVFLNRGESVDIESDSLIVDPEGRNRVLAILEIPKDGDETGVLMLGHNPKGGFFIASPRHDPKELDREAGDVVDWAKLPVQLSSSVGEKYVFGRPTADNPGGLEWFDGNKPGFKIPARQTRHYLSQFGPDTSRQQMAVEVTETGLRVTDTSTNGTRVIKRR